MIDYTQQALEVLQKYYGYSSFRKGQMALINTLLNGNDVMGIMPTGAGKSICYQVPAMLCEGITIVISPLIALMSDQVASLVDAGIPAAYFNSNLTWPQYKKALQNAREGKYKIIYVAPERLETELFLDFARNAHISLVAVDEAHCVSQWGQNFRPSYLKIPEFLSALPHRPLFCAFTATATVPVQKDMKRLLGLRNPSRLVTGFDRDNLFYEVQIPKDKKQALLKFLQTRKDECGIIYCQTRNQTEEVCSFLQENDFNAAMYHAGLSDDMRNQSQKDFIYDRINIMVATNAFGMGIDKSNVRYVVHYSMPQSLENYYQEAGRAGRDGQPSHCLLLYAPKDFQTARFLIEKTDENNDMDPVLREEIIAKDMARLRKMNEYVETRGCLRQFILHYFGQKGMDHCSNCSNCLKEWQELDVTEDAHTVWNALMHLPRSYGLNMVADVLKGASTARMKSSGLISLAEYGAFKSRTKAQITSLLNEMICNQYLKKTDDQYGVVQVSAKFRNAMQHHEEIIIRTQKPEEEKKTLASASSSLDKDLFEVLRVLRKQIAFEHYVPPYIVFSDQSLWDMVRKLPSCKEEMLEVSGVGEKKFESYGPQFLQAIKDYLSQNKTSENENQVSL